VGLAFATMYEQPLIRRKHKAQEKRTFCYTAET